MDTSITFDLAIFITFFEKKVNQFVTYNSQIDFLVCRRCHLNEVIYYVNSIDKPGIEPQP